MRILANDIGAGTQDILLFDSSSVSSNWLRMVMPSPTVVIARRIDEATQACKDILLTGVTMGGGADAGALHRHIEADLKAFATPEAAKTFDDDLAEVRKMGVTVVSDDEARKLTAAVTIELKDLQMEAIESAFGAFDVDLRLDAVAVGVLDHGAAPPGVSDRAFRFEHLRRLVQQNNTLRAFAYLPEELPPYLTRMKAVVESFKVPMPLLLMDTPASAALGALQDPQVASHTHRVIVNCGNAHTLGFNILGDEIYGLFEHHTSCLNAEKLDLLIERLLCAELTNDEVFADGGHGAHVLRETLGNPLVAVTGPRRKVMAGSSLHPYFAAPHGDMMLTGSFGLVRAFGFKKPGWQDQILKSLSA